MINVKDITKIFYPNTSKEVTVLEKANLTLPDTGMVFIVGQSGIGKSTILNAIGGLINYDGEITYDNQKVNIETYRKDNIGVIFQDFLLFDDISIRDNIRVGLEIAGINSEKEVDKRVAKLLSAVNLHVNASRKAGDLSLGQKQRVAIARALASNPKIILADEPTGNLDSANAYKIMDILKALSKNHLIICVTHNQTLVKKYADYAFSIHERKFEEFDKSKVVEDSNYVDTKKIEIDNFKYSEIKKENLLFKVYNDDSTSTNEIQIIKRGNEVLVVGEHISIARPSEISFIHKKEKEKKDSFVEEKEEYNTDLDFENVKSKKSFVDYLKYFFLTNKLKLSNTKKKQRARLITSNITRMIFAFIIFIVVDAFFGVIHIQKSNVGDLSTSSQVILNADKTEEGYDFSLEAPTVIDFVNNYDKNSIIEDPYFNPTFVNQTSSGLVSNDVIPSLLGSYNGNKNIVGSKDDPNNISSLCDKNGLPAIYFYSFEKAKSDGLCPDLNNYEINDNECLLNKSVISYLTNSEDLSIFVGKEIKVNLGSYTSYNLAPLTFKIKAIVDTPYNVAFVKNDLAYKITFNDIYGDNYLIYPDLKDVLFVNYEDIKNNPDYTINLGSVTDKEITAKKFEAAFSTLSYGGIDGTSYVIFSKEMRQQFQLLAKSRDGSTKLVGNSNNYYFTTDDANITLNSDPNKKIICFRHQALSHLSDNDEENEAAALEAKNSHTDSQSYFGFAYIRSQLLYNSTTTIPNNILNLLSKDEQEKFDKGRYYLIPDKLLSTFNFDLDSFNSSFIFDNLTPIDKSQDLKVFKTYPGEITDKIYLSRVGFNALKLAKLKEKTMSLSYNVENMYSDKATVYREFIGKIVDLSNNENYYYVNLRAFYDDPSNINNSFLSNDINKTKEYFDNYKYKSEKIKGYYIDDVFNAYLREVGIVSSLPMLITLGIFMFVYMLNLIIEGYAKTNAEKYYFGVLRNIGKTKNDIIKDSIFSFIYSFIIFTFVPTLFITAYVSIFRLFFMGIYYLIFLLAIFIINFLSELIPVFITLGRTPNGIIRSLN